MKLYPGHNAVVGVGTGIELVVLIVDVGCKLAIYGEEVAFDPESTSWYTRTELTLQYAFWKAPG